MAFQCRCFFRGCFTSRLRHGITSGRKWSGDILICEACWLQKSFAAHLRCGAPFRRTAVMVPKDQNGMLTWSLRQSFVLSLPADWPAFNSNTIGIQPRCQPMRISWWLPILTAGSPEELWAGLQHATGFSNAELAHLAKAHSKANRPFRLFLFPFPLLWQPKR